MVYFTDYQYLMQGDGLPDDLDLAATIQIPRFGVGQKIFRRYTLQKVIGRGGMGVVWLARDAYLESLVALKVLPDTLLHDSASLDSLKRETKMGLSLAHPNIVRIYDFQHDESSAAISMEYVDGGTLSDLRIKKPNKVFNPGDLTDWLGALFDGLDYAHTRKQIVHRDLKPRNLMLNARGELKIADFGISRCISDSMTMLTGIVGSSGTPPYISPQQWDGERPTPLDDIYSLGATLYELLSGKPPLLGVVDWQQVHHRIAPPISQRRIEFGIEGAEPIPQHWEETVASCLAKDPKKRPQTIRELEARLLSDNSESAETLTELPGAPPQETPGPVAESGLPKPIEISGRNASSGHANISSSPLPTRNPAAPTMQADEASATSQAKLPAGSSLERPVNDLVAVTPQKAVADKAARTALPGQARWIRMLRDAFSDKRGKIPLLAGLGVAVIFLILLISLPSEKSRDLLISAPSPAAFGDLTVESDPLGATIRLNEGAPLKAPHTYSNLKFGRHKIVASLEGYLTTQQELELKKGDSQKIVLKLAKKPPSLATLSVRSNPPGASILLDGNPPDKPPDTFTKLALGKHQLTATLEGFEPIQQELKIDVPNPEPLVIGLKAFGDLTIESEPSGAMIALDEGPSLKAPQTYSNVKFGRHKLSASLEGYLTTQQELELRKGDSQKIVLKLAKKPPSLATLSVRSTPPGASILLDGNAPDKPPDTFTKLALGKHQLTATLEGYEPIQQELKIDVPNPEPLVIGLKAFGDLTIESEPSGAMIALDEGPPLKAPHTYSSVKFGRHKLSASLEGYLTTQQELELKKGDSQKIVLKLAKKPPSFATLSVRSTPPGASILLDGNPPDKPPDTFTKLALGKHQLTATLEGFEPIQQELKIDVPNPEPLVIGLKAFGDLTIESEPSGAMIALDEGPPLKAPHTYSSVKFGRHKLSASLEGYLTTQQELELKKGDSQKIVLKLAKKPPSLATLSVRSTPPGASILLDGNPPDKPPDTFTKLALGKHQLTATLEGYEPIQQELKIDVPNPEPLVIGLKAFGDLTIESEPSGAMIALDEGPPLKAPHTYSSVKFGRHKLSASLEGYLTIQQELELKKGDSQKIVLKLAKKPPSFATLSVRSTPPGASILLDGNAPDKPPDTFTKLALGKHQLTATLEGFEPIQQELKIDVPNPEPLVIGLKAFGDLTIESEPSGAMIALDEGPPLKAPHTYSNVKFGRHKLSASLEGYLTTQQELELRKGDSQKIVLKLAKKPPSFATLSVRSNPPGASILVDGSPPDKPPDTFTKLALGKHQLTATLEGFEPIQQELKIDVPNPEPLVIGLKAFGDLTIESEPSGAMIALDEGPSLKAPQTYSNVKFGRHKLSASLEGYLTTQQELELRKGDSQKIVLKLAKKPPSFATLSVRVTPPGASILLDGNPPDKPPDTFTKLALGKHQLTATLEGFEPIQQELKIDVPNPEPLVIGLKAFGDLTIESEPSGAMIALDEGPPLKAPHTYSSVKFGRHKLSASLEGYLTTQQELELRKGDSQKIVLKLAKKPPSFATLSVRSTPPGASILLDGNPPDKPPDTFTKLALGKHQLTATLEGFEPIQQELKIDVPNPEPLVIGLKAFGDLTIESEPSGAMIALDEGPALKAPHTYSNVKFGRHKLSASLEGYLTTQQELELKKGDSQKIVLKLAKKPPSFATLSVRSTPPGASILLDGNPPDKPPDTFTKLALGKHQLTATLEGYEPIQQELKIDVPNPEPLVIGLKAFGDLTIESEPSGAMIALDEGPPLKAPHTYSNVKFGRHKLSASLEGYLTTQQELELRKGDSQKIVLKLAKKPPSFATLSVRSIPPGASILVDGNPPDKPPDTFTKLALGKHQLTATLEGYEPIQQELKIDVPNPEPLVIGLKAFGDLTIESEPSGAMIALDEGPPLKAPHTYSNVKFGPHKLSASLEGYLTTQQELELKKGDSQKIVLKLAKKPPSFATLSVRSNPPGASILLDGNPPDKPPDTFTKLALGKHQLTATLENYESIQRELKIDTANPDPLIIPLKHTKSFIRLQELVDQINSSKTAPDSPQYLNACVKYLQHLYLTPSPPSPELPPEELKEDLEKIIKGLRDHQALLKPSVSKQEFQKYEDPIRIAAQLGSTQALLMLAENEKEPSKKFRLFQDAALVKNNPDAMMMLGILSAKGVGEAAAKPNFEKALDWLKRASDAGNREAAAYYYDCFLFGDATKKRSEDDQKAAVESLEVLAKQGIAHAAVVLGEWYRRRASIAGDNATRLEFYREADDWWKMAKGPREWRVCFYLGALREMGSINDDGKPTEADLKEAKALYEEGASNEDVMCMFQLGRFIWDRSGASRNSDQKREALRYIKNAAAAGSEPAKTWLAKHENAR